ASWTGGSMAPAELPALPPDPSLPGHMATAALATAAGLREDMMGAIDEFLDLAPPIACGEVPWEPAAESDSEG
ncbi:MAG: hypothetical protein KDB14_10855, partial [Planctomycetales bacterium]|nr:hypothetical protein [Planctomycetales bacterium]